MNWDVPTWWAFLLLALAAFRVWRLLAEDAILDRPREWALHKLPKGEEFLVCPWCAGFWISVLWWLAWVAWPRWTLVVAAPFAINAIVGLTAANLDRD